MQRHLIGRPYINWPRHAHGDLDGPVCVCRFAADTSHCGEWLLNLRFLLPPVQRIATEIANDELAHVRFLRMALGDAAVPQPSINMCAPCSRRTCAC